MSERLFMDAVIAPNRSLSARGLSVLILVVSAINALWAVLFLVIGAAPVPLFLALDVAAVAIALWASARAGQVVERVLVSAREVRVLVASPRAERTVWVSSTAQTRVRRPGPDDRDVRLSAHQRELGLARALSPKERETFAAALDRAIWRARGAADGAP